MSNASNSAYPHDDLIGVHPGLTKREYFAAMAMHGLLYDLRLRHTGEGIQIEQNHVAKLAIGYANALIDELGCTP